MSKACILVLILIISIQSYAKEIIINPGENAQEELQEALILMSEGDTLIMRSGFYQFEDGISPGQACVFYKKDEIGYKVLGGGWIKN